MKKIITSKDDFKPSNSSNKDIVLLATQEKIITYLKNHNWKYLGDDGRKNQIFQHPKKPKIKKNHDLFLNTTRMNTCCRIPINMEYDDARTIVVFNEKYSDKINNKYELLRDLERHEDRWKHEILAEILDIF